MKKKLLSDYYLIILLALAILFEAYDSFFSMQNVPLYSSAVTPNIVLKGVQDLTEPTEEEILASLDPVEKFEYLLNKYPIIAHAGGIIDNIPYSNSLEALENSYKNGIRIIEVDISLSLDKKVVLTHGFDKIDYKTKMGLQYDKKNPLLTHDEFMNSKLFGKYTPMDANGLISFMKNHKDVYIIPDIKSGDSKSEVKSIYEELIKTANSNNDVLDRIVWTFLSKRTYEYSKHIYNFKIKNIHNRTIDKLEKSLNSIDKLIAYAKDNNFKTITMSRNLYTENVAYELNKNNMNVILFTSDSKTVINNLLNYGVTAIMSNRVTKK